MSASLSRQLERHGFTSEDGTCYVRRTEKGDIVERIMHEAHPGFCPSLREERVVVETVEPGAPVDEVDIVRGYTLGNVLDALDNPSEEYLLLSLRLLNGFHLLPYRVGDFVRHRESGNRYLVVWLTETAAYAVPAFGNVPSTGGRVVLVTPKNWAVDVPLP